MNSTNATSICHIPFMIPADAKTILTLRPGKTKV